MAMVEARKGPWALGPRTASTSGCKGQETRPLAGAGRHRQRHRRCSRASTTGEQVYQLAGGVPPARMTGHQARCSSARRCYARLGTDLDLVATTGRAAARRRARPQRRA
ncbi:MAG: hypothetical protein MZV65_18320 [Chromatiales bacterium]|nr:hypothetical protein [Chromatiales bacterium]